MGSGKTLKVESKKERGKDPYKIGEEKI